ncbi:hypothetical protein SAMN04487948_1028 [Halogranum amylolyticum]|uniref:Uncharacterized protein n=1 Tax=Halogranum amylolyticum TaxID=660520 RepID=A0A1H8NZM3_9EURY|nr:hypothetical protein [Halogranum amylolyticum]SEO35095.1 hypothetical protein SAMN04487948_1028 [Halogranum amylolyticum]
MEVTDGRDGAEQLADTDIDTSRATISVHQSSPDRFVFTEENNTDGWIATDLAVDLER